MWTGRCLKVRACADSNIFFPFGFIEDRTNRCFVAGVVRLKKRNLQQVLLHVFDVGYAIFIWGICFFKLFKIWSILNEKKLKKLLFFWKKRGAESDLIVLGRLFPLHYVFLYDLFFTRRSNFRRIPSAALIPLDSKNDGLSIMHFLLWERSGAKWNCLHRTCESISHKLTFCSTKN